MVTKDPLVAAFSVRMHGRLVLSCLLTLYTAVMSFEILFPFGLWVFEPGWLLVHSQLV